MEIVDVSRMNRGITRAQVFESLNVPIVLKPSTLNYTNICAVITTIVSNQRTTNEITRMGEHSEHYHKTRNSWRFGENSKVHSPRATHNNRETESETGRQAGTAEARERERWKPERRREIVRAFPCVYARENRAWFGQILHLHTANKRKALTKTIQKQKRSRLLVGPTDYTLTNLCHKYCIANEQSATLNIRYQQGIQ